MPTPTAPMFNFSLGDLYPSLVNEGVLPNPAAGTAPAKRRAARALQIGMLA
jgi:hypothetical protein